MSKISKWPSLRRPSLKNEIFRQSEVLKEEDLYGKRCWRARCALFISGILQVIAHDIKIRKIWSRDPSGKGSIGWRQTSWLFTSVAEDLNSKQIQIVVRARLEPKTAGLRV